jgi:Tfp pilus assembly protein PilF
LLNLQAQVALGRNDDARAAAILESVVARDPLNGRAILLLADYHAKQGDVDRAELYYTRAASVAATEVEALIQHARLLVSRRDFARATHLLSRAQSLRPQNHVAAYLAKVEAAASAVR